MLSRISSNLQYSFREFVSKSSFNKNDFDIGKNNSKIIEGGKSIKEKISQVKLVEQEIVERGLTLKINRNDTILFFINTKFYRFVKNLTVRYPKLIFIIFYLIIIFNTILSVFLILQQVDDILNIFPLLLTFIFIVPITFCHMNTTLVLLSLRKPMVVYYNMLVVLWFTTASASLDFDLRTISIFNFSLYFSLLFTLTDSLIDVDYYLIKLIMITLSIGISIVFLLFMYNQVPNCNDYIIDLSIDPNTEPVCLSVLNISIDTCCTIAILLYLYTFDSVSLCGFTIGKKKINYFIFVLYINYIN